MKKSTALLSLLLVFGGLCTQSQLFAMQRGRTVAKDTRSQDARAKLQQRAQAKKEELAKQKELATSFLEEKEFVESAEQLAQVNKALKESEDRMARAFGSDATFSAGEKKDGSMQQSLFKKYFCLKLPTQIALLLQFPKAFDQEFCLKNPVFIQKLLARPEPEIQELGQVAFAIRESGIYSQSFEQKFKTFKTLFNRMVSSQGAQDHHHYAAKLCKLTQGYYKYLYTCSTSETTETDRQYYRDLEQLARKYKDALSETNREYQSTLAKLPTSLKLPASLKPRLEPKKLEASSASAASAAASQPKQKTTTKKKQKPHSKKKKTKTTTPQRPQKQTPVVKKQETVGAAEITTQEKVKTPVVTKKETSAVEVAGESTTDTSTALAIPTSIKPKLPTQDDSQIVGDLDYPYFVTIKHPQLGKYLIYKPTTSPVVSLEAPRLTYRSRVQKYLNNPDQALEKDGYTEQHSDRPSILAKIKALKAFPHAADWLLKSLGVADTFTDKRGKAIPRLTLMGQIQPKNAKPIDGVFQWGFLPGTGTQTCYHRSGTEKVPEAMIGEYQQRQFNVEFPPLPDNGNGN